MHRLFHAARDNTIDTLAAAAAAVYFSAFLAAILAALGRLTYY